MTQEDILAHVAHVNNLMRWRIKVGFSDIHYNSDLDMAFTSLIDWAKRRNATKQGRQYAQSGDLLVRSAEGQD